MSDVENSTFMQAVLLGNLKRVKRLVKRGADIEETGLFGYTPLMESVREAHMDVTSFLIRKGANVNAISVDTEETALTIASFSGLTNFVAYLMSYGANPELGGCTALMDAAVEGNFHTVNYFLKNTNARIDAKSPSGYTPLSYACENNHAQVAELLLEYGADLENECQGGQTPLMIACFMGHVETARTLLKWNANVNHVSRENETALTIASANGFAEIVKMLLDKGSDVDHEADGGLTPLMVACHTGHLDVIKILVAKNADVNRMTPSREFTPLSLACFGGQFDVVVYLLSNTEANPNCRLKDNTTLLMETVKGGVNRGVSDRSAVKIAKFLLDYPHSVIERMEISESENETEL